MDQTVKLDRRGAAAAWNLLSTAQPKGRAEVRLHARAMKGLQEHCAKYLPDQTRVEFKDGEWPLNESVAEYVEDLLDKKLEQPIEGSFSQGYAQLCDEFDLLKAGEPKKEGA